MDTLDRMLDTMTSAFSAMGRGGARWVSDDGVGALVSPHVPNRSIVNCVRSCGRSRPAAIVAP